jgi:hypothetical protein
VSDEKDSSPPKPKTKDAWDKAQIIVSATSSVILATVALLVNSTIQSTQVAAAKEAAKAQTRSENAKMTSELMQHLLSNDASRQQIALIALRRAVRDDDEMVVDIVSVVATNAHDDRVFDQAVAALSESKSARVASVLGEIYKAKATLDGGSKSARLASAASQHVAISASLPAGTVAPPLVLNPVSSVPPSAQVLTKVGSVDLSRFVGLHEGDTPSKAIDIFGQPTDRNATSLHFGNGGLVYAYVWMLGTPGISGITVFEAGAEFVKAKAGSDPLLDLLGKSQAQVMAALGQPGGVDSVVTPPNPTGWYMPVWTLGPTRNLRVAIQSGVCKYITLNWH